jgi:signal transduction histidine kinase
VKAGVAQGTAAGVALAQERTPLAQLLHALNQPLTGLQCSMEVALGATRSAEQYRQGLREGLELTARMRELVAAIREVVDGQEDGREDGQEDAHAEETVELNSVLQEALLDLKPVAESRGVGVNLSCDSPLLVGAERRRLFALAFRLIEAALGLAAAGSELRVEVGGAAATLRVLWHGERPSAFSRSDVALLVAQAGWEQIGAEWRRERDENGETVTISLARTCGATEHAGASLLNS